MIEQNSLRHVRDKIRLRCSPLLDLVLSLLVLHNPERFPHAGPWVPRVTGRMAPGLLDRLREYSDRTDLFALAGELEGDPPLPVPVALAALQERDPDLGRLLLRYWDAIAPEVAAQAGVLADSVQRELGHLAAMDPLAFICRFSDRIGVAGDGDTLVLHWGKGMRVPLADLERILFVPSAFCPRRLMFYRLGAVQIFFYTPLRPEPAADAEPPESLLLGLAALADATRLKLLRLIAGEGLPAQEMARRLDLNESTVSRHLRTLTEAGLVNRERQEGKFVFYSLIAERIDQLAVATRFYVRRFEA